LPVPPPPPGRASIKGQIQPCSLTTPTHDPSLRGFFTLVPSGELQIYEGYLPEYERKFQKFFDEAEHRDISLILREGEMLKAAGAQFTPEKKTEFLEVMLRGFGATESDERGF
jgi:hypothetical protein